MLTDFLYRHRDRIVVAWLALGLLGQLSPPRGWIASGFPLLAGIALRLWTRRHIGPHSRGRILTSPERSVSGPYRWFGHPLYVANLLVASGIVLSVTGPSPLALLPMAGPAALYLFLSIQEGRRLRRENPPLRSAPPGWRGTRIQAEWASVVPVAALWSISVAVGTP